MKKINKVIMGLAAVAMLGSCSGGAKTATAEEAKKAVEGLSVDNIEYTSAKVTVEVTKLSSNGTISAEYIKAQGESFKNTYGVDLAKGAKVEMTIEGKDKMAFLFINSDTFATLETQYKAKFTVDGTAVSYEYSQTVSQTVESMEVSVTSYSKFEFNAEGLAQKEVESMTCTFGGDSDKAELETTTTVEYSK